MKKKPAKKKKVRALGTRCLVCKRKALPESLACQRHQDTKVNAKHFVLPYVVLETESEPTPPKAEKNTLYECARCGYALLTEADSEHRWSSRVPQTAGGVTTGQMLVKRVCKSAPDCARRTKDLVAGRTRVQNCSRSMTL